MTKGSMRIRGDRMVAVAFAFLLTLVLAALIAAETGATFTATSQNPGNQINTLIVQPPASQSATVSGAGGVVNLSWTATPTAPGAGHTLTYLVLRGPVGGPYTQIASTTALAYGDTPPADGSYGYVIRAQVNGGGSFTSGDSTARSGVSDRVAPGMSITCDGAACTSSWYTAAVAVVVSGTDGGSGMGSVARRIDGGSWTSTGGASASFGVSGDSAGHSVQYYGTDAAGNVSGTATATIKIDGTAPTVPGGVTLVSGANGGAKTVELSWTASTDATSGMQGYEVRWTGPVTTCPAANATNYPNTAAVGAVTAYSIAGSSNSDYCAYVVAIDNAGNRSANSAVSGPATAK